MAFEPPVPYRAAMMLKRRMGYAITMFAVGLLAACVSDQGTPDAGSDAQVDATTAPDVGVDAPADVVTVDTGKDAAPACDLGKPFNAPTLVADLSSPANDLMVR